MDNEKELRAMFGLPEMSSKVADSIGLEFDEFIDVELPVKRQYKPRGRAFSRESDNPQKARWKCLQCDMESSISGIIKHHKYSGHVGKQRIFPELEKLGII